MKTESGSDAATPCRAVNADIKTQCLRILRCTARALANSPGGLRFKAGTRPWLDGLSAVWPGSTGVPHRRSLVVLQVAGDQAISATQAPFQGLFHSVRF